MPRSQKKDAEPIAEVMIKTKKVPTQFQTRVYKLISLIPPGKVSTYGTLSSILQSSPRAVGQALRVNPYAPIVPCHRVVTFQGKKGGFSGHTCGELIQKKFTLLKGEKVKFTSTETELWEVAKKCILTQKELENLIPDNFDEMALKTE